ncbi:MAG: hypothetical protein AB1391_01975 [Candidatus Micrarchaeota archaeon]
MAKICIVCEKEPIENAYKVCDDVIIKIIRTVKQKLNIAKNNELFVCESCISTYKEKRKKFEKNFTLCVAIAVIIFIMINGFQLINGKFSVILFFISIFLAVIISALAVLNYAAPPIENSLTSLSTLSTKTTKISTASKKQKIK